MHLRARRGRRRRHPGPHRRTPAGQPPGRQRDDPPPRGRRLITTDGAIRLTKSGEALAQQVVRRHRLAERFLTDMLGLSWADAHHEAGKWEHVMSDAVEQAMDRVLGSPTTCPHGNPIPGSQYLEPDLVPLSRGRGRQVVHGQPDPRGARVHARVCSTSSRSASILPGRSGMLTAASPDGTMTIEIEGHHVGVGSFASARILVIA